MSSFWTSAEYTAKFTVRRCADRKGFCDMKKRNSVLIKKILKYISNYRGYLLLTVMLAAVSVILTLYVPILAGDAIDLIVGKGKVDFSGIFLILRKIAVIIAVTGLCNWLMNICNNKIAYSTVRDLRTEVFEHMQTLPLKYADTHSYGDTVSRIISDADTFSDGLLMGFTQLFSGIMTIIITIVFMISINLKIALVVVLVTPVSLFVSRFIASRTYSMFRKQSETRGEQTSLVQEAVTNQKTVQAFSQQEHIMAKFDEINERLEKYSLKATFFSSLVNPSTRFVNSIVYALVAVFGALSALGGTLTVGGLSCLLSYANQYTKPFNEISGVIAELQNAFACAARVFELLEQQPQSSDGNTELSSDEIKGNIKMENVSFSYNPEKSLIKNLNADVKPGQRIAIVGPTGCGKTTLINLLMRFYDVNGGKISLDDTNINDLTRSSLRKGFGMVLQDTWIKSGTIRENITIAKPDADDSEVIEAAKKAHAHSFIRRLPNGYDTVISGGGSELSQGERQLLCIARLMLCRPSMLILDEATSSIDTRTEMKIQDAFETLMKGRTSFIVAHRLSTIKNADLILVMRDGSIVEQGTHTELMAKNGFYSEIYNSQFTM